MVANREWAHHHFSAQRGPGCCSTSKPCVVPKQHGQRRARLPRVRLTAVAPRRSPLDGDQAEDGSDESAGSDPLESFFAGPNPVDMAAKGLEEARQSAKAQAEELAAQFAEGADEMSKTAEEFASQFAEGAESMAKAAEEGLQAAQKSVEEGGKRFEEAQAQWVKLQADFDQWREGLGKFDIPEFKWPDFGDAGATGATRLRPVERSRTDAAIKFLEQKWDGKTPAFGKRSTSGMGGPDAREMQSSKEARAKDKSDPWFEFWSSTVAFVLVIITSVGAFLLSFGPSENTAKDDDNRKL